MKFFRRKRTPIPVDVLSGYARWAKHYPATAHNPLMEIEQRAMLSLLPADLSGKICLDLACGSGRYLLLMQQRGANKIFGTDYSADMLAKANLQSPITNYRLTRAPFFPLPFSTATFDLITCGLAVGHEKSLDRLLAETARVLRPGGILLYSDFHPFGALLGWQRTFTADNGTVYNVEHHVHLYSHHQRACRAAGLAIEAVLEPVVGEHASPENQNVPAVLVIKTVKG